MICERTTHHSMSSPSQMKSQTSMAAHTCRATVQISHHQHSQITGRVSGEHLGHTPPYCIAKLIKLSLQNIKGARRGGGLCMRVEEQDECPIRNLQTTERENVAVRHTTANA